LGYTSGMRRAPLLALLLILASAPLFAEEIVYLKSGSAMPVRSHQVVGDMVHLDLGGDAFIAFPMALVDRIENTKGVELKPSHSNVIRSAGGPQGVAADYSARGLEVNRVTREQIPKTDDPHIQVDPRMGIVGYVEDPSKGERSSVSTGRRELLGLPSSDAFRGTSRLGNKFVIQGGPKPATRAPTVGIRFKGPSTFPPPPAEPPQQPNPLPNPSPNPVMPRPTDDGDGRDSSGDPDPGD
jgi:hypothetical protein